jgi:tellurite resistance protein TerC
VINLKITYRWARRIAIALVGGTVLLVGCAMVVLPGPAIIVIPAGLAILGLEFAWARVWLAKVRRGGNRMMDKMRVIRKRARGTNATDRRSDPR